MLSYLPSIILLVIAVIIILLVLLSAAIGPAPIMPPAFSSQWMWDLYFKEQKAQHSSHSFWLTVALVFCVLAAVLAWL